MELSIPILIEECADSIVGRKKHVRGYIAAARLPSVDVVCFDNLFTVLCFP